jgi:hypothetical protein
MGDKDSKIVDPITGRTVTKEQYCKPLVDEGSPQLDPADPKILEEKRNSYYQSVESENAYPNKITDIEANYFTSKYDGDIYNKLIQFRLEFLKVSKRDSMDYKEEDYSKAIENIHVLNQVLTVDKPIMNVIDKYIPEYDSNTIYREIEYRDKEYERLYKINYYLNILYYCLYVILIILLFTSDRLFLDNRITLYIFLAVLPFLYPWAFLLFRRIYKYLNPPTQYTGPKNAFIDTNISQTAMFSNNVSNSYKNKVETTTLN